VNTIFKKILSISLRISISIILLVILFYSKEIDLHSLLDYIHSANKPLLLLAFSVTFLSYILCFCRWNMLLKATNIHLPIKRVIMSFCGGIFFSLLLPSSIGGDFARSIDLAKHTQKPKEVIATVLMDRLSGYVGLVIIALFSCVLGWKIVNNDIAVLASVAIIVLILIFTLLILFNKFLYTKVSKFLHTSNSGRIRESIKNLLQEIHYFRDKKRVLFESIVLSLIIQANGPIAFYITALAVGISGVKLLYFFIFVPIIGAITLLPIAIGGFGIRESTSVLLFAKAGINGIAATAIALLNSYFIFIFGAIGGIIYALTVHHRRIQYPTSP
jgi:uncharacterized protein (TIRG00374 family)